MMFPHSRAPIVGLIGALMGAVTFSSVRLCAHDMWIEPTTFAPKNGEVVGLRFRLGQDLLGDPLPRDPRLINQFVVEDATGRKPVIGRDGGDPAGFVRAGSPGVLVVGYHSNASAVELPADKFNQYLKEEGLDAIAALRVSRNQVGAPSRELFSRYAKTLIASGPTSETQGDRRLGFPFEIVAERNPYALRADQDLPLRVTFEDRPLAGVLVVAMNRLNPFEKQSARTDKDGRVRFRLRLEGMWLVKAVHMVPATTGSNADWMSFWASLTFGKPVGASGS
jgi:uncharacterized GH25 family protein